MNNEHQSHEPDQEDIDNDATPNAEDGTNMDSEHPMQEDLPYDEDLSANDLEQALQNAIQETELWREKALRAVAEMENNRRRLEKDKEDYARYANASLIKALLPVVDNLSRAVQASNDNGQDPKLGENLRTGVEMVAQEINTIFSQHHVVSIHPEKGTPFDPQLHEAMTEIRDESLPASSIALVLEPGYQLHDRLLRPCRVAVNARDIHTKGQAVDVKS